MNPRPASKPNFRYSPAFISELSCSAFSLIVKKGAFPAEEIAAVNAARQAKYSYFKVREY